VKPIKILGRRWFSPMLFIDEPSYLGPSFQKVTNTD